MSRKLGTILINAYQATVSPFLSLLFGAGNICRFEETCSQYTKRKINEEGLLRGVAAGLIRIAKCQPFYNMEGVR